MAGEGELTVIATHNDRSIPVSIEQSEENSNTCEISFVPEEGGISTVQAFFNGDEVPGKTVSLVHKLTFKKIKTQTNNNYFIINT